MIVIVVCCGIIMCEMSKGRGPFIKNQSGEKPMKISINAGTTFSKECVSEIQNVVFVTFVMLF